MMELQKLSRQLRHISDSIDELFAGTGSPRIAKQIQTSLNPTRKKFSYDGKHWTQRPENKAKVKRLAKKMWTKRRTK